MRPALLRASFSLAALAAASIVASCASPTAQAEAEARAEAERIAAEIALQGPPVALNQSVAESAAVYIAFARDMATIEGGFESPEAIQAALARASGYDPEQLSRGLIAYASILALQSPEFVQGVRGFNTPEATRQREADDVEHQRDEHEHQAGGEDALIADAAVRQIAQAHLHDVSGDGGGRLARIERQVRLHAGGNRHHHGFTHRP